MLRLAILGALGYLGYRYLGSNQFQERGRREAAVAGGPLSNQATLQSDPDQPPSLNPIGEPAQA